MNSATKSPKAERSAALSIAIVGSGAIGLYYGAALAFAGQDVRFLMRSDLPVARERGVRVVMAPSARGGPTAPGTMRTLHPVPAHGDPRELGPVDAVLVTLKTTANAELGRLLPPLLKPSTVVATLQNGLGNEEALAAIAGEERVLGALCFIASTRTAPAEVTCYHPGTVNLGEWRGPARDRTREIAALFAGAGIQCTAVDRLMEARWRKLVWNVPFNGLAVAEGGITTDLILRRHGPKVRALMDEVAAVGRKLGHGIPEEFIQRQIDVTGPMGPYRPSTLVDFLAGREIELEAIWGEPLRQARNAGVETPHLAALYERLRSRQAPTASPQRS